LTLNHRTFSIAALIFSLLLAGQPPRREAEREFKAGEDLLDAGMSPKPRPRRQSAQRQSQVSRRAGIRRPDKILPGPLSRGVDRPRPRLAIDSKDQRRQAMKLLTQLTLDVHKSFKRFESAHSFCSSTKTRRHPRAPCP
jgi:hypothetical protein